MARLRLENSRLAERNLQLAAELAVRPGAEEEASDTSAAMPGDSFPAVAASLDIITDGEATEGEEEQEQAATDASRLLARLRRGGSRMEQIKRQLVAQRGAIVSALRLLAEARSARASRGASLEGEVEGEEGGKLCPMCEASFPAGAEELFEQHVMDHFAWDAEQDTLLYMGEEQERL